MMMTIDNDDGDDRRCLFREEASFCAVVDGDGEVADFLRLPHIMKRRNGWNRDDAELKVCSRFESDV